MTPEVCRIIKMLLDYIETGVHPGRAFINDLRQKIQSGLQ